MKQGKKIYKIRSFLNASSALDVNGKIGHKSANTFEIMCSIKINNEFVPFTQLENAVENVIKTLTGKDLNELPQFKNKDFSIELLTEYLAVMINNELLVNKNELERIEVAKSPTKIFCLDFS